jgi:phosphoglycolate phosphatase-like HAD superfamily hydrolase
MPSSPRDIIVDIDGTLADCSHRLHHIRGRRKQWKQFFAAATKDKPRVEVLAQVRELARQHSIHLVTGRPAEYRQQTLEWLSYYRVPFVSLHMRESGDHRPDDVIKQEILDAHFSKENIELVIDDRPRVIRMWQRNGLRVLDVGDGVEF